MRDDAERAWKTFDAAVELVRQGIADARRLINRLRDTAREESGLKSAIEGLISEIEGLGGPATMLCWELHAVELSPRLAHAVYRIVQECLTNVARHSRSTKAQVTLSECANQLKVEVQDWGVGFDPANAPKDGVGLEGIRLRARMAGGRAIVNSALGRGSIILVELPLEQETPGAQHLQDKANE